MDYIDISKHAKDRAKERFSVDVFPVCGKKPTRKQLKKIKSLCPKSSAEYMDGKWRGRYALYNRHIDCVYIIEALSPSNHLCVTVFSLNNVG